MTEVEHRRFRLGESSGRPLGGYISPDPFPQALFGLARSRGYESQLSLARTLGYKSNSIVQKWYTGKSAPTPKELGRLLILLQPNDEELDSIIDPYGELLQEGRAIKGRSYLPDSNRAVQAGQANRKQRSNPFDKWMEEYCDNHQITLKSLARSLGFQKFSRIRPPYDEGVSLNSFSQVLQNGPQALNLSPEQTATLSEAVAVTIEEQIAAGRRYTDKDNWAARKLQVEFACRTYTPVQAAKELGVTREYVRQLRNKFSLPLLLTEDHLEMLKNRKEVPMETHESDGTAHNYHVRSY